MSNPTNIPFPPGGTQLTTGAGVLTGAQIPSPVATNPGNAIPPFGGAPIATGQFAGITPMAFKVFDTANGSTAGGPIASVSVPNGYAGVVLDVAFTNGLYVVQSTPSSINFSFT